MAGVAGPTTCPCALRSRSTISCAVNPVTELDSVNDPEAGVRLLLSVGTVTEDIMVFGQPPCSAGRMKHRRVYYLGLLGLATNGQCDTTDLYSARFGQPRPGQKVFILTCQTKDGWKAQDSVFSAIVLPSPPSDRQQVPANTKVTAAPATETPSPQAASAECSSLLPRSVYKGRTPDARGVHKGLKHEHPVSISCSPLVHDVRMALSRLGMLGTFGT